MVPRVRLAVAIAVGIAVAALSEGCSGSSGVVIGEGDGREPGGEAALPSLPEETPHASTDAAFPETHDDASAADGAAKDAGADATSKDASADAAKDGGADGAADGGGTCKACIDTSCKAERDACTNDATCKLLSACLDACVDGACKNACFAKYRDPVAKAKNGALYKCTCITACAAACTVECR